ISYQLSVISYQLSVISYQLSVISYQLSVISYQLSVISYQFLLAALVSNSSKISCPRLQQNRSTAFLVKMKYGLNLAEVKIPVAKTRFIHLRNAVKYSLPV
ncbi:hypothetical protein, partial [Microcystis sp. M_QC_C_20170808_M3Col]|uniref:hypothetical protein n=3 Tax=Microcystis TaxID=1125 RepID=UPI00118FB729